MWILQLPLHEIRHSHWGTLQHAHLPVKSGHRVRTEVHHAIFDIEPNWSGISGAASRSHGLRHSHQYSSWGIH